MIVTVASGPISSNDVSGYESPTFTRCSGCSWHILTRRDMPMIQFCISSAWQALSHLRRLG